MSRDNCRVYSACQNNMANNNGAFKKYLYINGVWAFYFKKLLFIYIIVLIIIFN